MDRKTLLAVLLSAVILILWSTLVAPRLAPPPEEPREQPAAEETGKEAVPAPKSEEPAKKAELEEAPESPEPKPERPEPSAPEKAKRIEGLPEAELQDNIEMDVPGSPLMTTWTNRGAALRRLAFRDYYTDIDHKENLTLLKPYDETPLPLELTHVMMAWGEDLEGPVEEGEELDLNTRKYEVSREEDNKLTFKTGYKNGLEIRKTVEIESGAYHLSAVLQFKNNGKEPLKLQYTIAACGGIVSEDPTGALLCAATVTRDPYDRINLKKIDAGKLKSKPFAVEGDQAEILWAGCDSKYFAAMLHPERATEEKMIYRAAASGFQEPVSKDKPNQRPIQNAVMKLTSYPVVIPPGGEAVHRYLYFVGPKDKDVLAKEGKGELLDLTDYGMFGAVSKVLLWLLDGFYKIIPNYGFGIIFITLVVKLCLHPLTRKTQTSMHRMQKLQPLINEMKEKYKNDPKRMQMEQWSLFKKHRVNPFGGCLPMFIQIPVFLGLFRALQISIVFRQAPFVLWINDLSQPDRLATLPFHLPFGIGNQLNLLPILMTATWLIQQATMPKPADPQQAQQQKIMLFMPVMFGFMLYNMASGLTLYWMVSTLLGIFEQAYIKKIIAQMPEPEPVPETSPKKSARRWR